MRIPVDTIGVENKPGTGVFANARLVCLRRILPWCLSLPQLPMNRKAHSRCGAGFPVVTTCVANRQSVRNFAASAGSGP